MNRSSYLERHTPLRRVTPIKATRWGIAPRSKPKRATSKRHDPAYLAFVRTLPCCNCGADGPSEAAHVVTGAGQKGASLKVDDRQAVPLCHACHMYFDGQWQGPANPFRYWRKERKRIQAARWVRATQLLATPGDNFDRAPELQAAGLGVVFVDLVDIARDLKAAGETRLSAKMIFEVARFRFLVRRKPGEKWALDNSLSSRFARTIEFTHPEFSGMFETRRLAEERSQ